MRFIPKTKPSYMKRLYALFAAAALMTVAVSAQTPANTCGGAVVFTGAAPWTAVGSTAANTNDYNEVCPYSATGGRDAVIAWNPPATGFYDMSLCQGTTNYDTKLYVYAGSCPAPNSGAQIACNDDLCSNAPAFTLPYVSSLTNVFMTAGTVYYIVVDGYSAADFGNFTLLVQDAAAPPTGAALAIGEGRMYDYSFIPEYNLQAANFAAVVGNLGTTTFTDVRAQMQAFSSADGFVAPIASRLSNVVASMPPGDIQIVTGTSPYLPADTGVYLFEYVVQSPGGTGSSTADDTSFSFLSVDENTQERSLAFFGAPLEAVRLAILDATAEYGVVQEYNASGTLNGATMLISVDPLYASEPITANVYEILGGNIDSLNLVATGSTPADTGALVFDVPLSGSLPAGDYILAYNGSSFPVRTTQIMTNGASNLVRGAVTGGDWAFFAGDYAWSQQLLTTEDAPACDPSILPTNQAHTVLASAVRLTWTPTPLAVACQVQGKRLPTGPQPTQNVTGAVINQTNVPFSVAGAGTTWTWRVRCACQVTPTIIASGFSPYGDTFSVPAAREGEMLDLTLFPSPADNMLMVAYTAEGGEVSTVIVDMMGREVMSRTETMAAGVNNFQFDVTSLENGNYFLRIEENGAVQTEAFSVMH